MDGDERGRQVSKSCRGACTVRRGFAGGWRGFELEKAGWRGSVRPERPSPHPRCPDRGMKTRACWPLGLRDLTLSVRVPDVLFCAFVRTYGTDLRGSVHFL